ncbi:hypothetical protein [Streptomyces odonnellii]|uniref:hypothetical protein n=1 Tax=Streptomyces odonnellii TaxID=1417980 RepID=UPI0006262B24|nr:hypothetical protein [Streptomyces odonnellii]
MISRFSPSAAYAATRLPEPPPPLHLRTWPDHEALLADRAAALATLTVRRLGIGRLVLLWLLGAVGVVGWAAVGLAIQSFEQGGLGQVTGLVALFLAAFLLIPAGVALGFWLERGRTVRLLLEAWADLARDPAVDGRVRAHRRCVLWLLPSLALCLLGVWATSSAWSSATTGPGSATVGETVYALGLGLTVLATGVLGAVQSYAHQSWSGRFLSPVPERWGGGAHR